MTYTLVVGAAPAQGAEEFYRRLVTEAAFVVAADGGGEWCVDLGRVPDVVVGDFDSARAGAASRLAEAGADVHEYPRDKDRTDLELAVEAATERAVWPVVITAAFTRRLDHTLAALGTLAAAGPHARAAEPGWSAYACTAATPLAFDAVRGDLVSILSVGESSGVSVDGTAWQLRRARLAPLSGHGVSNSALGGRVTVTIEAGMLIVMVLRDDTCSAIY
jgi:thiamine pyrophosphokinase